MSTILITLLIIGASTVVIKTYQLVKFVQEKQMARAIRKNKKKAMKNLPSNSYQPDERDLKVARKQPYLVVY